MGAQDVSFGIIADKEASAGRDTEPLRSALEERRFRFPEAFCLGDQNHIDQLAQAKDVDVPRLKHHFPVRHDPQRYPTGSQSFERVRHTWESACI